jgi:hypothetical protein
MNQKNCNQLLGDRWPGRWFVTNLKIYHFAPLSGSCLAYLGFVSRAGDGDLLKYIHCILLTRPWIESLLGSMQNKQWLFAVAVIHCFAGIPMGDDPPWCWL